jgi:hypothetical protein
MRRAVRDPLTHIAKAEGWVPAFAATRIWDVPIG